MRLKFVAFGLLTVCLVGGVIWSMRRDENVEISNKVESIPVGEPPDPMQPPEVARPPEPPHLPEPPHPNPWFTDVSASAGIDFQHNSGTNEEKPFPAANGSGIAALDFDRDGLSDLYFATGTPFPIDENATRPVDRFYRNLGSTVFQEVTEKAGLGHNGYTAGIAVGDYDNDGFSDVYLNCFGANVLYRNMGDGTYQPVSEVAKVADPRWGTSAAFCDYDSDGLLDLYVCNYAKWTWEARRWCGDRARNVRIHCSPHSVEAESDILYRNLGDGTFADVTKSAGLAERHGRAQGVIAADLNGDGHCDLYLGNDLHANSFFINRGDSTFQDATELSGVAYDYKGSMQAGMGVDAADVNGDGLPELFVTNFSNEHNALYVNASNGLFQEASQQWGLYAEGYPWVGWGAAFADFDLDGGLDLVVTNGHVDHNRHLLGDDAPYAQPPLAWRHDGSAYKFLGNEAGEYFSTSRTGRALIIVDLDDDGDQDVVVGHQDDFPAVLRNERLPEAADPAGFYSLQLIGTASSRDAIGAAITMRWNDKTQYRQVKGGGSYLSSHDLRQVFALPRDADTASFEIQWPGGGVSIVESLPPGHLVIRQPMAPSQPATVHVVRETNTN